MTHLVLLSSPLLGPSAWHPVAGILRSRGWRVTVPELPKQVSSPEDVLTAFLSALPDEAGLVLVPHSNAGLYVAAIAAQRDVAATVFVDATLPDAGSAMTPPELLEHLQTLVDAHGLLPPWTRWWPDDEVSALFSDPETRLQVEAEEPRLPLAYFRADPPPSQEPIGRAGYLAFGDGYAGERDAAAARGWPVRTLAGRHLHMLVDPGHVAGAVQELLAELRVPQVG